MTVAVYPRLGPILAERKLTVVELARQLRERFGLEVNLKTLYRLAQDAPVQRADLEIAGATAAVLGVGLDDLFDVQAVPLTVGEGQSTGFSAAQNGRLSALFGQQAERELTAEEYAELESLLAAYSRDQYEQQLRAYADRQGIGLEPAREAVAADYERALDWWRAFEADPERRRSLIASVKAERAMRDE